MWGGRSIVGALERVDVVDEDDAKIGTATRGSVHRSGAWHRGVHVLVFNRRGELLLQRRSATKDKSPSKLDLSVSEHSKAGESFEAAAVRGLREELGVDGANLSRVLKFKMAYGPGDNMVSTIFQTTLKGELRPDGSEVEEVIAVDDGTLRRMVDERSDEFAPWALQILRWRFHIPSILEEIGRGGR